jgi:hypothetical protein
MHRSLLVSATFAGPEGQPEPRPVGSRGAEQARCPLTFASPSSNPGQGFHWLEARPVIRQV